MLVLGAGFGGLELTSRLSEELGDQVDITLIDRAEAFVFGFSKLDVMFGKRALDAVRMPYGEIATPRVRFRQESITAIDPVRRRVETDLDAYEADFLVVALGADYDVAATPGLAEAGNEFYSVPGAEALRDVLPSFSRARRSSACAAPRSSARRPERGRVPVGRVPARTRRARRCDDPGGDPVRHAHPAVAVHVGGDPGGVRLAGIGFVPDRRVASLDQGTKEAVLDDGRRLAFDLFLGIPVHRAPAVVEDSGLTVDGWIPVDPGTLATRFPGVYAVGDVTSVGTPKAGVFAERQASVVADHLIARIRSANEPLGYDGTGTCYIEFGGDEVARVDVDFYSTPGHPTGIFVAPSEETAAEKADFASVRRARWFGS